jgi:hypothetical protein
MEDPFESAYYGRGLVSGGSSGTLFAQKTQTKQQHTGSCAATSLALRKSRGELAINKKNKKGSISTAASHDPTIGRDQYLASDYLKGDV